MNNDQRVSIVIPYYNTPRLIQICLRALRRYTPAQAGHEVIVVNNGATDGSDAYLRKVRWIRLIDRQPGPEETENGRHGSLSHGLALNLAWEQSDAPYFLTMHTDTIIKKEGWLDLLLAHLNSDHLNFAAGSWKMEVQSSMRTFWKILGDYLSAIVNRRVRERLRMPMRPFLRSHCTLYRRELLKREGLFPYDRATTCGQGIHYAMEDRGYRGVFIPVKELILYIDHLNHMTMVLNPELGSSKRSVRKGRKRLERFFNQPWVRRLETDDSLDL